MPSSQGPNPQGLRLERVERLNDDVWAGVAAVDRGQAPTSFARAAVLAAGDSAAFLLFATIGRVSHHEALSLGGSFETALPFLLGWFAVAPFTGGFSKEAQGGDVGGALGAAAKSWALATPLAIAVRSLSKGYIPDKAFIIVSFAATAVLLLGWRAAATKMVPDGGAKQRANKKGNPLEFIGLLFSLVKRW